MGFQLVILLLLLSVFYRNFLFKLVDLLGHPFELHSQLCNFLKGLPQVFTVEVSVGAYCLIQVLLLFQTGLLVNVFLLKFGDKIVLQLHLFETLVVLGISL